MATINTSFILVDGALQKSSNLSDLTNAATARSALGLGSIATQAANSIALTGGTISGITLGLSNPAIAATQAHLIAGNTTPSDGSNFDMTSACTPQWWMHSPNGFVPGQSMAVGTLGLYKFERGYTVQEMGAAFFGVSNPSPRNPVHDNSSFTDGVCALFGGGVVHAGGANGYWAGAFNAECSAGWTGLGCFGLEVDMNNFAYYANPGNPYGNIANIFINGIYSHPATAGTWQTGTQSAELWTSGKAYTVGYMVEANGNIYRCIVAGTSGVGSAPAGTTNAIPDGSVAWAYVSDASQNYCSEFGDWRQGKRLVKAYTYFDDTESRVVLRINNDRTHSEAVIHDSSAGPYHTLHDGLRTAATWSDQGTSPIALDVGGSHGLADVRLNGGAGTALLIQGSRSGSCIDMSQSSAAYGMVLSNQMSINFSGTDFRLYSDAGAGRLVYTQANAEQWYFSPASISPARDNGLDLGDGSHRVRNIYAANATIITSDATLKQDIRPFSDQELDAVGAIPLVCFRFRDAYALKGEGARRHAGVIAQQVVAAFAEHGIDAYQYGLVGHDPQTKTVEKKRTVTRPKLETVTSEREEIVIENGIAHARTVPDVQVREVQIEIPVYNADGTPRMISRFKRDENGDPISGTYVVRNPDGSPVMIKKSVPDPQTGEMIEREVPYTRTIAETEQVQATVRQTVMVDEIETYTEEVPVLNSDGTPKMLLNVRYSELLVMRQAWLERELLRRAAGSE
jgi:hypothetical protein